MLILILNTSIFNYVICIELLWENLKIIIVSIFKLNIFFISFLLFSDLFSINNFLAPNLISYILKSLLIAILKVFNIFLYIKSFLPASLYIKMLETSSRVYYLYYFILEVPSLYLLFILFYIRSLLFIILYYIYTLLTTLALYFVNKYVGASL